MLPICNVRIKVKKPEYRPFPEESDKSLGACLKRKRLELGWTQKECANHFGVLKDSYQKWEWNQIIPHIRNRKKVVEFLSCNFWDDGTQSLSNQCLLYRIERGIVRKELAEQIDVSEMTIDRIENCENNVSKEIQSKLEKLLVIVF